jgi:polyhydroxyalkanoate synthesis repressor PhaR
MGRQVRKCPIECADRGAGGTHDDDVVFHLKLLSLSKFLGGTRFLAPPHPRRPCGPVNMTCLSNIRDNWGFFGLSARDLALCSALPRCHKTVAHRSGNWLCSKPGPEKRVIHMAEEKKEPVTIKKYANRRLYNTGTSTYVTLEDLAAMVKNGEDFIVYDAKTGEDITRSVLAQIIFEQENKGGQSLLPITFLRQLIRFYGDSMQMLVPRFLEASIESLSKEQGKFREQMAQAFGVGAFGPLEEQVRRNMEMFEKTFAMFAPFARGQAKPSEKPQSWNSEMDELKRQLDEMQKRLDKLGEKE